MNPRPEIVLPPGFALRIDYDPESSPASLLITAYRDDAPVGQAHLQPREVGHRLRLEVEENGVGSSGRQARLRLTPQRATRAIMMDVIHEPAPRHEMPPAVEEHDTAASDRSVPGEEAGEHPAMIVLRELALEGAFDECADGDGERPWGRVQRAIRSFSLAAADLLGNPLRLRDVDVEGWPSWRASWRGVHQPSGASEG